MYNDLRKNIGFYLKESLSEERYLDNLSNMILKHIAEQILNKNGHLVYKKTYEDDGATHYQIYSPDFDIYKYTLELDGFPENIKNWIEHQGIRIIMSLREKSSIKGYYKSPKTIYLCYNSQDSFLKDIWEMQNKKYISFGSTVPQESTSTDIYVKLYFPFHSTLLHELRHAFDDYRSKGNYLNTKRWEKYKIKSDALEPFNPESEQSVKQHSEKHKSYLKLAHEINARFSQALAKVRFDKFDDNWEHKSKKPFNEVLKDFKYEFENWRILTPKMQQWITKRLYKYWDEHEVM